MNEELGCIEAMDELWREVIEENPSNKRFYNNPWPLFTVCGKTCTDATATGRPVYIPGDGLVNEEESANDGDFGQEEDGGGEHDHSGLLRHPYLLQSKIASVRISRHRSPDLLVLRLHYLPQIQTNAKRLLPRWPPPRVNSRNLLRLPGQVVVIGLKKLVRLNLLNRTSTEPTLSKSSTP
ncbi:hypothetical protein CNG02995 [Cryptococcus deneoformans JEC21]|uniref:Uncharacterized protein n=1 Tax=Cryptococcus deneoformans (strain JEC21 / ATCC MYA-565) TaxID=214684 RepID=A0A0S2M5M5_CRYD1|nr:hypothetical protein CNG02995 [Cryptococcus neoformans var. neoformans JEC21]ALO69298.1 hypothetical protein CNG02995 [Cryptococcus neoformans var. neoformans JEC21]